MIAGGGLPARAAVPGGKTEEYFARLRLRLRIGLLAAFVTPLVILSVYFHVQFNYTLKESGKLHLAALAESQRNTIDLFLQERVVNIFSLFHGRDFHLAPTQGDMHRHLANLQQASDAFIDVGFLDPKGIQVGYAGPYPRLLGKSYSGEKWFIALAGQRRDYYISDIYLGFRNKPHFTIGVRQIIGGKRYVMRATLDPDKFYLFLESMGRGKGVDSILVSREGRYQAVDPDRGEFLGKSDYLPPVSDGQGVEEVEAKGEDTLVAYAWLKETPWALVARQPLGTAYAQMYRARRIVIAATLLITVLVGCGIWFVTGRLMERAQATAEAREDLKYQLLHASKLASVGELAAGVAHEINNPLAIISAESGVLRDMQNPRFGMDRGPEAVEKELDAIDQAVVRARGITQKLLDFARKDRSRLVPCNVNRIMDEVVSGLKEREFQVANIKLVRDYDLGLPEILLDPDQIGQVFLNLINNAGDAMAGGGTLTLSTRRDGEEIRISVTDTGLGMDSELMKRIFVPFFTTKEVGKGTGLGLSVSLGIVESMGGRIEVQSLPGAGSSFSVILPARQLEEENGERG